MKNSYYIICLLVSSMSFSQVGINTVTPVQDLHIGGATENVKVDGLNTVNNTNNLGMVNSTKVYVDADGDLTLATSSRNVEILFDSENYLEDAPTPNNLINQTGGGFGYTVAGIPLAGIVGSSFTLTKPAIIEVNYSVSWQVYKTASTSGRIADEHARIIQTGIFFRDAITMAPVITDVLGNNINDGPWCVDVNSGGTVCNEWGGMLGINGQFYNNSESKNGEYANYHNTASDYVRLNPGTYVAFFAAQLAVGDTGGTGAVKMHLGTGNDDLQIIAHYYD
jgi:hypothetical protein